VVHNCTPPVYKHLEEGTPHIFHLSAACRIHAAKAHFFHATDTLFPTSATWHGAELIQDGIHMGAWSQQGAEWSDHLPCSHDEGEVGFWWNISLRWWRAYCVSWQRVEAYFNKKKNETLFVLTHSGLKDTWTYQSGMTNGVLKWCWGGGVGSGLGLWPTRVRVWTHRQMGTLVVWQIVEVCIVGRFMLVTIYPNRRWDNHEFDRDDLKQRWASFKF
jgi:hypothetical protein